MSVAAMLIAARDIIRSYVPLPATECGIQVDGQPPYVTGDRYVSIWSTDWSPGEINAESMQALDEDLSFACTITYDASSVPMDREAEELWLKAAVGMEQLARCITAAILNNRKKWLCDANQIIMDRAPGCPCPPGVDPIMPTEFFYTVPVWEGTDPSPRPVGPEWFSGSDEDFDDSDDPRKARGYILDVRFTHMRRTQRIPCVT